MRIFFFNDTAPTEIYTLSLHDALPICGRQVYRGRHRPQRLADPGRANLVPAGAAATRFARPGSARRCGRSEEHTSELQSHLNLVCRLLLEKKKTEKSKLCMRLAAMMCS